MNPSWVYQEPSLNCHSPAASIILIIFRCSFVFSFIQIAWAIPREKLVKRVKTDPLYLSFATR